MSFSSSDDEVPLADGLNFDLDSIESSFTSAEAEAGLGPGAAPSQAPHLSQRAPG